MSHKNLSLAVTLVAAFGSAAAYADSKSPATFNTYCTCPDCKGEVRWDVKTDRSKPPAHTKTVRPSEIADWPGPGAAYDDASRTGEEAEWYRVTGRVTLMRLAHDGDIHLQIVDKDAPESAVNVLVEIPLGKPWCAIRKDLLALAKHEVVMPLTFKGDREVTLDGNPIITVVGHPMYDGWHGGHAKTASVRNNTANPKQAVWEIHPVMELSIQH